MKPRPIFKHFSPKGQAQAVAQRPISWLAITLAVLLLSVLTACAQAPVSVLVVEESAEAVAPAAVVEEEQVNESASLAENPELLKVRPPAEAQEMTEAEFLAANPELKNVRRYTVLEEVSQPDPYEIELLRAQRYAETAATRAEAAFLARNPELMAARRYATIASGVDPDQDIGLLEFFRSPNEIGEQRAIERNADDDIGLLEFFRSQTIKDEASRPDAYEIEIVRAQRYAAAAKRADTAFLAANPELMVTRRYIAVIEE